MTYKEFIEEYGDREVQFRSYYKYTFCFEDEDLVIYVGGNQDEIYKFDLEANKKYRIILLEPYAAYLDGEELGYWH